MRLINGLNSQKTFSQSIVAKRPLIFYKNMFSLFPILVYQLFLKMWFQYNLFPEIRRCIILLYMTRVTTYFSRTLKFILCLFHALAKASLLLLKDGRCSKWKLFYQLVVLINIKKFTAKHLYTLSNCPGGHPILHRGLKLNSKNSAGK